MKDIENLISTQIESQFPEFMRDPEVGSNFILFVKTYYEWLEQQNNLLHESRSLMSYKDIDTTIDDFIIHFKNDFLNNIQFDTATNKRLLVKNILDLYRAKGTPRAIDLLFKLVFATGAEIYYPGSDIFKLSDGDWYKAKYLEVSYTDQNRNFVGKLVRGLSSGAVAFVDRYVRRLISSGKYIDIFYISNLTDDFQTNETLSYEDNKVGMPFVVGSMSELTINTTGDGFVNGDIVEIVSDNGVQGLGRITSTGRADGIVSYTLKEGGFGYTNTSLAITANANLTVEKIVQGANLSIGPYFDYQEPIIQPLANIIFGSLTGGIFSAGDTVKTFNGSYTLLANANILTVSQNVSSSNGQMFVSLVFGNMQSNTIFHKISVGTGYITCNTTSNVVIGNTTALFSSELAAGRLLFNSSDVYLGTIAGITSNTALTLLANSTTIVSNATFKYNSVLANTTTFTNQSVKGTSIGSSKNFVLSLSNTVGSFRNNEPIIQTDSSNTIVANGYITKITQTAANVTLYIGNTFGVISTQYPLNGTLSNATSNIANFKSYLGLYNINSAASFTTITGNYVYGQYSNTQANVTSLSSGVGASFSVNNWINIEDVYLDKDLIDHLNANGVYFYNLRLDGSNSNSSIVTTGTGTITTTLTSNVVTGVGTSFATSLPDKLLFDGSNNFIGYIASRTSTTGLTLLANAAVAVTGGAFKTGNVSYGFSGNVGAGANTLLIDLLSITNEKIGTISTLGSINPGNAYSSDPITTVFEPYTYAYLKQNQIITVDTRNGAFLRGESVKQVTDLSNTVIVTVGNAGTFKFNELVNQSNASATNAANGYIVDINIASSVGTLTLTNVKGTFVNTTNVSVGKITGNTSGATANVVLVPQQLKLTLSNSGIYSVGEVLTQTNASGFVSNGVITQTVITGNVATLYVSKTSGTFAVTTNVTTDGVVRGSFFNSAGNVDTIKTDTMPFTTKAEILQGSTSDVLYVKKLSLGKYYMGTTADFIDATPLIGEISDTYANVVSVQEYAYEAMGNNAYVEAKASTANGTVLEILVADSGFGYVDGESVSFSSNDTVFSGTATVSNKTQGENFGFYQSTKGFLSQDKYLHDGHYYQEYSYEVRTDIAIDKYSDMLKKVLHVAGTKYFGAFVHSTLYTSSITSISANVSQATS